MADISAEARDYARRLFAQKSLEGFGAAMDLAYESAIRVPAAR
jgi:hypothetical protein